MSKFSSYAEKLRDPKWQKKRLEILDRDKFTCQRCRDKEKTLNVHHRFYRKGAMPWDYKSHELVTLCEDCHKFAEDRSSYIQEEIAGPSVVQEFVYRVLAARAGEGAFAHAPIVHGVTEVGRFLQMFEGAHEREDEDSLMELKACMTDLIRYLSRSVDIIENKVYQQTEA